MNRIKLTALPVPLATWMVWTKDEQDEDVVARYQSRIGSPPTYLVEYSNHLWAGPIPEES
jgi:hypothetical protein